MMTSSGSGGPATDTFDSFNANALIVIVCSALAGYNALELILLIFTTFTTYKGLYFWSLLIATFGIIPYAVGLCVFYFAWTTKLVGYIINNYGWITMVTGQSVVLYSRLGIVLGNGHDRLLKFVKWMIIVDGTVLYVITTVVVFGSHYAPNPEPFAAGYSVMERVQMTGFTIQEFIISGIYVWKTLDILKTGQKKHKHRIMWQLFAINVIIIVLDIGLLVLEYRDLFIPEVAFKELSYSIKLKLEFAILSKLVEFSSSGVRRFSTYFADTTGILDVPGRGNSLAMPPTPASDTRPQWLQDVEKVGVMRANAHNRAGSNTDQEALSASKMEDSLEPGPMLGTRLSRNESDLMYAEAMRVLSR